MKMINKEKALDAFQNIIVVVLIIVVLLALALIVSSKFAEIAGENGYQEANDSILELIDVLASLPDWIEIVVVVVIAVSIIALVLVLKGQSQ